MLIVVRTGQFLTVSILLLVLITWTGPSVAKGKKGKSGSLLSEVSVMTGSSTGTYYKIGRTLESVLKLKVDVRESNGSVENIRAVAAGKADMALCQLDILSNSVVIPDEIRMKTKVVFPIYREEIHIITTKSYKGIEELKGTKISIGPADSGIAGSANIILIASRLKNKVNIVNLDMKDGFEALEEGDIDAMFLVAGAPVPVLRDRKNLHLVGFSGNIKKFLTSDYFPYREAFLTREHYPWLLEEVPTISIASVMIVNASASADFVRHLLSSVFKAKAELVKKHEKWSELDVNYAISMASYLDDDAHPEVLKFLKKNRKKF